MDSYIPQEIINKLTSEETPFHASPILRAVIWTDPEGYITHTNRHALQLFGAAQEEVVGHIYTCFFKVLHLGMELGTRTFNGDSMMQSLITDLSAIRVWGSVRGAGSVSRRFEGSLITLYDGQAEVVCGALVIHSADHRSTDQFQDLS